MLRNLGFNRKNEYYIYFFSTFAFGKQIELTK